MKGFNIAPQPSGSGSLPPVDEFAASLQQAQQENSHELFGSTLSGIFGPGTTPKKSPHHTSTNSVPGLGTSRQSRRIRGSSKKKRWENLIEAAKVRGKVSRLIGKSSHRGSSNRSSPFASSLLRILTGLPPPFLPPFSGRSRTGVPDPRDRPTRSRRWSKARTTANRRTIPITHTTRITTRGGITCSLTA